MNTVNYWFTTSLEAQLLDKNRHSVEVIFFHEGEWPGNTYTF